MLRVFFVVRSIRSLSVRGAVSENREPVGVEEKAVKHIDDNHIEKRGVGKHGPRDGILPSLIGTPSAAASCDMLERS